MRKRSASHDRRTRLVRPLPFGPLAPQQQAAGIGGTGQAEHAQVALRRGLLRAGVGGRRLAFAIGHVEHPMARGCRCQQELARPGHGRRRGFVHPRIPGERRRSRDAHAPGAPGRRNCRALSRRGRRSRPSATMRGAAVPCSHCSSAAEPGSASAGSRSVASRQVCSAMARYSAAACIHSTACSCSRPVSSAADMALIAPLVAVGTGAAVEASTAVASRAGGALALGVAGARAAPAQPPSRIATAAARPRSIGFIVALSPVAVMARDDRTAG